MFQFFRLRETGGSLHSESPRGYRGALRQASRAWRPEATESGEVTSIEVATAAQLFLFSVLSHGALTLFDAFSRVNQFFLDYSSSGTSLRVGICLCACAVQFFNVTKTLFAHRHQSSFSGCIAVDNSPRHLFRNTFLSISCAFDFEFLLLLFTTMLPHNFQHST